ncbi:MAG: VWA domain-containing protein [Planctomycetes bacterium]|nr:VWA domain-containing protein [Planctomycetota bacterium]
MPTPRDNDNARAEALHTRVIRLQETLRVMEEQREHLIRRRRRHVLIVGVGISLVVHLSLMYFLASRYRLTGGGAEPAPVSYEFAILQEEELTRLESAAPDELLPEVVGDLDDMTEEAAALDPTVAAAELEVAGAGALPTLGGAGEGTGDGSALSGGGAGTSFFGVSSRGMRFAYIVDRSGSMSESRKMRIAMRELARSIETLPDYAYFHIVLFSTEYVEPPMQRGWMRAKRSVIDRLNRWLDDVPPSGGTEPMPAFYEVFALDVPPDVIFFLTDGEIPDNTPQLIAEANQRGGRVTINTIAFGDDRSQALLRQIARESGGAYRFVSAEGR